MPSRSMHLHVTLDSNIVQLCSGQFLSTVSAAEWDLNGSRNSPRKTLCEEGLLTILGDVISGAMAVDANSGSGPTMEFISSSREAPSSLVHSL
ncbi:hypothetical protein Y1Q_0000766 [Alligator mississippiensis]|uniref:Uncharacterized protein n=1 Tax=Alligator mississippiensis TaxID=8496 RepID=A0A151MCE5_ALLMI|nr:hypothetical protein Y1Q_0000766 [Alligator mississippiensis]